MKVFPTTGDVEQLLLTIRGEGATGPLRGPRGGISFARLLGWMDDMTFTDREIALRPFFNILANGGQTASVEQIAEMAQSLGVEIEREDASLMLLTQARTNKMDFPIFCQFVGERQETSRSAPAKFPGYD